MDDEILAYRITRKFETELLQSDVIDHNFIETNNIHNTHYIMSVGTSWLRANPGSNIRQLEEKMAELGVTTIITATPYQKSDESKFHLCVPGNPGIKPMFVARFDHGRRDQKEVILNHLNLTAEENLKRLELAGYSCPCGQADEISGATTPTVQQLRDSNIMMQQLQWASIKITIERMNTEKTLQEELEKINKKYGRDPYRYRVKIEDLTVDFLVLPEGGKMAIISEFGTIHRNGKDIAIHIKTLIRNMYREKMSINEAEKTTEEVISRAIEQFKVENIIGINTTEKNILNEYLNPGKPAPVLPRHPPTTGATAGDIKEKLAKLTIKNTSPRN